LRLQVDEAGRPGKGVRGGQDPLMGLVPPRTGLRPAGQGIGQFPQRREILLIRDRGPPLSQLLGTPLRVAADALPRCPASPERRFFAATQRAYKLAATLLEARVNIGFR
jgi:hypothetical protein